MQSVFTTSLIFLNDCAIVLAFSRSDLRLFASRSELQFFVSRKTQNSEMVFYEIAIASVIDAYIKSEVGTSSLWSSLISYRRLIHVQVNLIQRMCFAVFL